MTAKTKGVSLQLNGIGWASIVKRAYAKNCIYHPGYRRKSRTCAVHNVTWDRQNVEQKWHC